MNNFVALAAIYLPSPEKTKSKILQEKTVQVLGEERHGDMLRLQKIALLIFGAWEKKGFHYFGGN